MSQRASSYPRLADDDYATSAAWVAVPIAKYLHANYAPIVWEPAAGAGMLAKSLEAQRLTVFKTRDNFLESKEPPFDSCRAIVTNPPYGRRADEFIRHALTMPVNIIAMLLNIDFDSAKTRVDMFRDNRRFALKIVLLDRIVWFEPKIASPSTNHAWFIWHGRQRYPHTRYAGIAS